MDVICGIYKIENIITGDFYIGSSINILQRFSVHKRKLKKNEHHSLYLQRSWNKYGEENFKLYILLVCEPTELIENEQKFMNSLKPSYNMSPTAGSCKGRILTESHKLKIKEAQKGKPRPWQKGIPLSEETHLKMSLAQKGHKGYVPTKEIRDNVSKVHKGKILSESTKEKISTSLQGTPHSDIRKLNQSMAMKASWKKRKASLLNNQDNPIHFDGM